MIRNKVFICDDDIHIAETLELIFKMMDVDTIVETDSAKAYGRIKELRPAIVIVDLHMPVVSGKELIRMIRSTPQLKKTFILCISATDDGRDVALESGANMILPKPFDMEDIIAIVEKVLNTKFPKDSVSK